MTSLDSAHALPPRDESASDPERRTWLIGTAGCPVDAFDGPMPISELPLALSRRCPRAIV